jgi:hypothetical protein
VKEKDFNKDIGSKSYLKYKFQSVLKGQKMVKKETFLRLLIDYH